MKKFSLFGDAGVADTVTLEIASCYDSSDTGGGANARIRAYDLTNATRKGEVWNEQDGTYAFSHDLVIPATNIENYQMKWEALSGSTPNDNSVAVSTWQALGPTDFFIGWDAPGDDDSRSGTATVSIRKGTGSTLDSAVWDGDVSSTPPEKDK